MMRIYSKRKDIIFTSLKQEKLRERKAELRERKENEKIRNNEKIQ